MKKTIICCAVLILLAAAAIYSQQPVAQSTPGTAGNAWYVAMTDLTNVLGTSSHPVRTDPTGATTQPISAASLPLPTGAATAAKQPALGTAGSASADVITIQGIASMTAVKVDGSAVTQPVSGTFWQATQPVSGTFWQATQPVSGDTNGADGSTGSAVPSKGSYSAGNGSGNLTGYLNCDTTEVYDNTTNGATQLLGLVSGKKIYVCGYQFSTSQTTSVHVALEYGTGTNCATSPVKITPNYPLQAATSTGPIGLVVMTPGFTGLQTIASNELCVVTDAAVSVQAIVWVTQF